MPFSRPIHVVPLSYLIWLDGTFDPFVILVFFYHKSDLTLRKAQELLEELVVGVDNDREGRDQVEHQQDFHSNFHLK